MPVFVQLFGLCIALFGLAGCVRETEFYPFGAAAGDQELARADDESSAPLLLEKQFPYYDREESILYVNTNGLLSFEAPSSQYNLQPFPLVSQYAHSGGETFKVIAPFWGDVDNTNPGSGRIWYRQTTTNATLLSRAKQNISEHFLLYPKVDVRDFNPSLLVIITWDHVGYFSQPVQADPFKTNTFQCVLVSDGKISFAMFLYAEGEIMWTTGDSGGGTNGLGGTPAQAGFSTDDGKRLHSLPLSHTAGILDIDEVPGNTGEKGLWIFRVDQSEITNGVCSNDGIIHLLSNSGNVLGGSSVVVIGPCFDNYKQVFCDFEASLGGISPEAVVLDGRRALCVVPQLHSVGRSSFKLTLVNHTGGIIKSQERNFFSLPSSLANQVNYLNSNLLFESGSTVELTWIATDVFSAEEQHSYSVDVALYGLIRQGNAAFWTEISQLVTNMSNTGHANITLPTLHVYHNDCAYLAIAFQVRFSQLLSPANRSYDLLSIPAGIWSKESYYRYEEDDGSISGFSTRERCIAWASFAHARLVERMQIDDLPPCPCNLEQAEAPNSGFHRVHHEEFFNPGATVCYYQSTPTKTMSARQCCYDDAGGLIDGGPGGGHSDFISPLSDPHSPHLLQLLHFEIDTAPFLDCCKARESLCMEYYKFRPSAQPSCQHNKLVPAFVYGDPHFVTLDGLGYTFNGKGEYVLIETNDTDTSFTLQGRMTEVTTAAGMPLPATVLSALVAKQTDSDTVQFEISRLGIDVLVNGELVELSVGSEILAWNAVIMRYEELEYGVHFSCGVKIEMKRQMDYLSAVIVSLPESYMNHTVGLLGYFNGNETDDLLPPLNFGLDPLPPDSNLFEIHENFGQLWRLPSGTTLFTYPPHEPYDHRIDAGFTPDDNPKFRPRELEQQAILLCDGDRFCLYDIAITGLLEVGNLTKMTSQRRVELVDISRPIVCDPPCQNGTCVRNNTCNCRTGYSGPTCNIENLSESCVENPCLNGGSCKKLGDDSLCQCSPFTSGFNCQQNTPFHYNCTSVLEMGRLTVRCNFNKPVESTICTLDSKTQLPCTLPLQLDLANLEITSGNHKLRVTATDITGLNQTAVITFSVEPLNFTCKSGLSDQRLVISNCSSNNKVSSVECFLNKNGLIMEKCELPLIKNLNRLPAGMYIFNISATDIYRLHDAFIIKYTKEPLKLSLINSSPRLWDGQVIADFTVNRERGQYTVMCDLGRQLQKDCTAGYVRYDSVPNGIYNLKITARSENGDRDIVRRKIVVRSEGDNDYCAAHFINNGVEVYGQSVKVQFHGTQSSISYYMCKLDSNPFVRCRSPYRLEDLEPGEHRIKIYPVCVSPDQRSYRVTARFTVQ